MQTSLLRRDLVLPAAPQEMLARVLSGDGYASLSGSTLDTDSDDGGDYSGGGVRSTVSLLSRLFSMHSASYSSGIFL